MVLPSMEITHCIVRDLLRLSAALPSLRIRRQTAHADDAGVPFDAATVRNLARELAQHPYKAPDATLPDSLKNSGLFGLSHHSFRSRSSTVARPERVEVHRAVPAPRLSLQGSDRHLRGCERTRPAGGLQRSHFTFDKITPPTGDIGFAGFACNIR